MTNSEMKKNLKLKQNNVPLLGKGYYLINKLWHITL